jgi:hypothetical protein
MPVVLLLRGKPLPPSLAAASGFAFAPTPDPGANRQRHFFYSTDGSRSTSLGAGFVIDNAWQLCMGYRLAIFSRAGNALGGALKRFASTTPLIRAAVEPVRTQKDGPCQQWTRQLLRLITGSGGAHELAVGTQRAREDVSWNSACKGRPDVGSPRSRRPVPCWPQEPA